MADGVVLNSGSGGSTAATDDCGAAGHAQVIKLAISADGDATLIPADAAQGLDVDVTRSALPTGAATSAKQDTVIGHLDGVEGLLTTIDADTGVLAAKTFDFDSGAGTDTVVASGIAVAASGGAAAITGDVANGLDVDVTRLPALVAGSANIGDVDVLTVPAPPSTTGGGTEATALRVTLASDSTGLVSVDDNGGSLTVDNAALAVVGGGVEATALRVTVASDSTGVLSVDDNGGALTVDGTVTVTQATAANLNCTEASAASIATNTSNAATSLAVLDDWDNGASDGASVSGDVAHDTADAGEPVKIGAQATTSLAGETLVADADRTNLYAGLDGVLITRPYCNLEDILSGVDSDTAGDSTSVIAAQGAGIRIYVTSVIVKNTHASTDAYVDIRDGAAGSVKASIPAPAAGGAVVNFPVPLRFTANTEVAVDPSAAVTTIITTVVGFKSKV